MLYNKQCICLKNAKGHSNSSELWNKQGLTWLQYLQHQLLFENNVKNAASLNGNDAFGTYCPYTSHQEESLHCLPDKDWFPLSNIPAKNSTRTWVLISQIILETYTYDLCTTLAVRGAGGCLTAKKGPWCGAVFVDIFHFLLLFVIFLLFVTFISYFLLLKQG